MPKKTPKVSVLMPAYNSEKYIAEAIESILNQTFADFEFIIINDGSTDNTAKIVQKYAKSDKRIRFINHTKNKGLIAVLNEGLGLCVGEYIARFDSDDISLPERFARQVEYMDAHPECGVVGAWINQFDTDIKQGNIYRYPPKSKMFDFIIKGCLVAHPVTMIRKSVLDENKIKYNPAYKYAEDYGFWIQIAQHTEIHNVQQILLNYRWYGDNISIVHSQEQSKCTEQIRRDALQKMIACPNELTKLLRMTRELNERFYLFRFLPIIRRKQYSITKTKYYLFEKIPLIKEQDGKIYLFECIKIGCTK